MSVFNPLEQFQVNSIFTLYNTATYFFDLTITNYHITGLEIVFFLIMAINVIGYFYLNNGFLQRVLVGLIGLGIQMIKDHIGNIGKALFPLLVAYLLLVVFANLIGMIPYGITLTAQLILTLYLSLTLFISLNIAGVKKHELNFLSLFFPAGTPLQLAPLIVPIEIVSYVFRVISLSVRLFANMMAGHTLLKVIAGFSWFMFKSSGIIVICGLIPLLVVTILVGLELGVACIQAYVFITLASMYFHDAFLLH